MRRRYPLPRSAPPAPSDTTSAAPIRRPGTRPPGNPASSAPNSPRPRPSTRQRRSGILPSSDRDPGPVPPAVRLCRNIPSRRRPGPGPRVPHFTPFVVDAVALQCCSQRAGAGDAISERIVQRGDQVPRPRHILPARSAPAGTSRDETANGHGFALRPPGASKRSRSGSVSPSMSARGEHVAPAVRTHRRQRQPHIDGEPGHTAQALPRHRLAALRRRRRQMRTQQTPRAQLSSTARRTTSFVPAADSSQPSQRAASIGASVIDRQRTMAPRRARSRPGARSRVTKSPRAAVSGSPRGRKSPDSAAARPIRPMRTGRNPHAPRPGRRRASARIRATSRSDFRPGCPAMNGRRAGAHGSRHRTRGGRVDNGGTNRPGWG